MIMTPEEIFRHYRQAQCKSKDITVLADLNATDKASIRALLIDGGLLPPDSPGKPRAPRGHSAEFSELAAQGLPDVEIADKVGCSLSAVSSWRYRQKRNGIVYEQSAAGASVPQAAASACKQLAEPRQTDGGDIYTRLEAILSAVPVNCSKTVREQASALLTSIFDEYISRRLGLEPEKGCSNG